jgi:hypothetical protein
MDPMGGECNTVNWDEDIGGERCSYDILGRRVAVTNAGKLVRYSIKILLSKLLSRFPKVLKCLLQISLLDLDSELIN